MSRLFPRSPAFHRFAALLALLAMLVPVATSLVHHPDTFRSFIHICGMNRGVGGSHDKAPVKLPSCPICQSQHSLGGGLVPPAPFALALIFAFIAFRAFPCESGLARFVTTPQARPRAPPAFA